MRVSTNCVLSCVTVAGCLAAVLVVGDRAVADPCGMVPPYNFNQAAPPSLARVGQQRTYAFHKDGVETFVIRPAFAGKVEEFGMLIPFPEPPAIRKVPDDIFEHITSAVDPPEVKVSVSKVGRHFKSSHSVADRDHKGKRQGLQIKGKRDIKVVLEEAVGMYDVAVLEAGSPDALERWMTSHAYQFPKGMEEVCKEYIQDGWCFVAVKTGVSSKSSVNPRPGQRNVEAGLPRDATFDGHVQAMGFRFHSDKLVLPMRLSTYNEGDLNNTVYVLSDHASRIAGVPEEMVKRQIPGEQLYRNLTGPLAVRHTSGEIEKLKSRERGKIAKMRDPSPYLEHARDLFASDLLSVGHRDLTLNYEKEEKRLQEIGARLGMYGTYLDSLHSDMLSRHRERIAERALKSLEGMTLTIIEGEYPRDVLAKDNLHFEKYVMRSHHNNRGKYDANTRKAGSSRNGTLYPDRLPSRVSKAPTEKHSASIWTSAWALVAGLGMVVALRRRRRVRTTSAVAFLAILLSLSWTHVVSAEESAAADTTVSEEPTEDAQLKKQIRALLKQLEDPSQVESIVDQLREIGNPAIERLEYTARSAREWPVRGWAIIALAEIGTEEADQTLQDIVDNRRQPELTRSWALAARVRHTASLEEIEQLLPDIITFPVVSRTLFSRLQREMEPIELFELTLSNPDSRYRQLVGPYLGLYSNATLLDLMFDAESADIRQLAAKNYSLGSGAASAMKARLEQEFTLEEVLHLALQDREYARALGPAVVLYPAPELVDLAFSAENSNVRSIAARYLSQSPNVVEAVKEHFNDGQTAEDLITLADRGGSLRDAIGPLIVSYPPEELIATLLTAENQNIRRSAAGYLASKPEEEHPAVAQELAKQLAIDESAKSVPWGDGPLFLPSLNYTEDTSRALVTPLVEWHVWCGIRTSTTEQRKIDQALTGGTLLDSGGYTETRSRSGNTYDWLKVWASVHGNQRAKAMADKHRQLARE